MESLGTILPSLGFLNAVVQDNTLKRMFYDALYPELLYRMEAEPVKWEAQQGETKIFTRDSLLDPVTEALEPGTDPVPKASNFEQWRVLAKQLGNTQDTNMPASRTALNSLFARVTKRLGLNAGQSMNQFARNRLFGSYLGGRAIAENTGPGTSLIVSSIVGFTEQLNTDGQIAPVSATNAKPITIAGTTAANVVAAAPTDPNVPLGPGTLTLEASTAFTANDSVIANDAAFVTYSGGGTNVDALATTDILTLADIRAVVSRLRRNRVPRHPDGFYHCHLDPIAEAQLFADNEFQRLNESNYGDAPYQEFAVGKLLGCIFYSNTESPNVDNTGTLVASRPTAAANARLGADIYAEVRNATSVDLIYTVITGGGSLYECYIDEKEYLSPAGVQGKVGEFSIVNNSIQIVLDRIRHIIRAPQDRLQQQVSQSWSWSGDFGVPSDFLGGLDGSRFKRAGIIASGTA